MTKKTQDLTEPDLMGEAHFIAYNPWVKPLGAGAGGGFRVTLDVSDDAWDAVKDLNGQNWRNMILDVVIRQKPA